jgi:tetratricopeptide (TPR) repeat protein
MRLNPHYPPWYLLALGWADELTGRYTEAVTALQETIRRNPNHLSAYTLLAVSYLGQWNAQQASAEQTLEPALKAVQQALSFNDLWYVNHTIIGYIYLYQRQYDQALAEMERAVAIAPNDADGNAALAVVFGCIGRTEGALKAATQALRLTPSVVDNHLANVGGVYALAGRPEEAIAPLQQYLRRYPNILPAHLTLAEVYSELGQTAEAQKEAAEVLRLNPNFSLEVHKQRMPIKDPAVLERHIAALRKAGLK